MHSQAPLADLTDAQRQAVDWQDGPLLVLAAPGSGNTHVLARRVVRLLDASRDRRFRILALTTAEEIGAHARPIDDFVREFACAVIRLPGGAARRSV